LAGLVFTAAAGVGSALEDLDRKERSIYNNRFQKSSQKTAGTPGIQSPNLACVSAPAVIQAGDQQGSCQPKRDSGHGSQEPNTLNFKDLKDLAYFRCFSGAAQVSSARALYLASGSPSTCHAKQRPSPVPSSCWVVLQTLAVHHEKTPAS
jgi:hypothetical protein